MSKKSKTEEQMHYESIISFLKWGLGITGGLISVIIGVAAILLFQDLNQVKQEMKHELEETKVAMQKEVLQNEKNLEKLREFETTMFEMKMELIDKSIEGVKEEAKLAAITESRERVGIAFESKNIKYLIEDVANQKVEGLLDVMVQQQIRESNEEFLYYTKMTPKLMIAVDRIRNEDRKGLDTLFQILETNSDPVIKGLVNELIEEKRTDYHNWIRKISRNDLKLFFSVITQDVIKEERERIVIGLKKGIYWEDNLTNIVVATALIEHLLQSEFELFNFSQIEAIKFDDLDENAILPIFRDATPQFIDPYEKRFSDN